MESEGGTMSTWPRKTHDHLLELQVDSGGETTYRCLECGLRVGDPEAEELAVRPCDGHRTVEASDA